MFPSLITRVLLAILVALPPGTFRALDAMTRSGFGRTPAVTTLSSAARSSSLAAANTDAPLRLRSWADVTFVTSESPAVNCDGLAPAFVPPAVLETGGLILPSCAVSAGTSPRSVHATPRAALIAACALLI